MASVLVCATGCNQGTISTDGGALTEENKALKARVAELEADLAQYQTNRHSTETAQHGQGNTPMVAVTDLDGDVPHADKIKDLVALDVFELPDGKFEPYRNVTRAEFVKDLYQAYNAFVKYGGKGEAILYAPNADPFFSDLPKDHDGYKYAQALANAGISVGYPDGTFKPDQPITREEMIGIKVGVDRGPKNPTKYFYIDNFSDHKQVDKNFTGYVNSGDYLIEQTFGKVKSLKPKATLLHYEEAAALWTFGNPNNPKQTASDVRHMKEKAASGKSS